jgi:hypothetical protein
LWIKKLLAYTKYGSRCVVKCSLEFFIAVGTP